MTDDLITRAKAALEGVTEGPWSEASSIPSDGVDCYFVRSKRPYPAPMRGFKIVEVASVYTERNDKKDATFIAAARALVPELIEALEATQRRETAANRAAFKHLRRAEKAEIAAKNYAAFNHEWRRRAERAEAKLAVAVEALRDTASQKTSIELDVDFDPCFTDGYDSCIHVARAALAKIEEDGE